MEVGTSPSEKIVFFSFLMTRPLPCPVPLMALPLEEEKMFYEPYLVLLDSIHKKVPCKILIMSFGRKENFQTNFPKFLYWDFL